MDKRAVKFAKGGKNGGQETSKHPASSSLPAIHIAKPPNNNGSSSNGSNGARPSRSDAPTSLPPIGTSAGGDGSKPAAPPSGKSSRKMSADAGPQVAEFAYSKAVEHALRRFGFWSSRPLPRGYKSRYLEADIPSLQDIYQDYVFMRKAKGQDSSPPQNLDEFRAVTTFSRSYPEVPPIEPSISARTPVGRDTPMPKRLRSGAMSRFPSLAVEIRMKKAPRKRTADTTSSRSVSAVSLSLREV